MRGQRYSRRYRITSGAKFRLDQIDPSETPGIRSKQRAVEMLRDGISRLSELQDRLYAQDRWALLLIFQAMDAAGKDSTIKHVMSGVNPQGCQVYAFKAPSAEELDHDYLWRTTRCLPERGRIGIFNRSYYEETLVVRVHKEILAAQKLPLGLVTKRIWQERHEDINAFERYLSRNGIAIRKFFLHLSKREQRRRFLSRLDEPSKNWKFSTEDVTERRYWSDYMEAYEDTVRRTATRHAPWYVVPADHKWFTRLVVADAVIDALEELDLEFPKLDAAKRRELQAAREALERGGDFPESRPDPVATRSADSPGPTADGITRGRELRSSPTYLSTSPSD
jgi:PPK2 family polyphosphate:nucleotide phosphotransferase